MNQGRTHDEIAELLGAYALDAVDPEERSVVDEHLRTCPRCAAEVAEHREVAAQLANAGGPAPDGLWERIVGSLEETPPRFEDLGRPASSASVTSLDSRRSFRQWLPLSAAAAVLVVVGLVAGLAVADRDDGGERSRELPSMEEVALRALDDPGAVTVALRSPDERLEATAVVESNGSGYLMGDTLPELDESQTYQLWGVRDGAVISLGILGNAPRVVAFHMDDEIHTLAVTAEVAGGVEKSANDAVVVGEIS